MSKSIDDDIISLCANCGKGEESAGDLKACTACKMVKYCNRDCQIAHRPQHKKACKKRAAELHDEKLFKQPPPAEDCPICFLPMPYTGGLCEVGVSYAPCCGKVLCSGCIWASIFATGKGALKKCCAFCREPTDSPIEEETRKCKKRMEAGDAETFHQVGIAYETGDRGVPRDKNKALEMWNRAADLGHADAHHHIADAYLHGKGVEKDDDKASYHLERAAIRGHEMARYSGMDGTRSNQ